jgi:transposase-like protein
MGKVKDVTPQSPMCEECDVEMYPFGRGDISGYACPTCGWSFDESELSTAAASEYFRVADQLYVREGEKLKDVSTGKRISYDANKAVPFIEASRETFNKAVKRVLKTGEHAAMVAAKMSTPDQCVFVAKQAFLDNLNAKASSEDLALIRQVFWRLSRYDGTTGLT